MSFVGGLSVCAAQEGFGWKGCERGERIRRVCELGSRCSWLELTHWVHEAGLIIDYLVFALRLGSGLLVWVRVIQ